MLLYCLSLPILHHSLHALQVVRALCIFLYFYLVNINLNALHAYNAFMCYWYMYYKLTTRHRLSFRFFKKKLCLHVFTVSH